MDAIKPKLWTPGDWNAFFGFGTNILVNLLTLTGLLRFVLKMPDALVFQRILPATGLMMCLSTAYYAWLAYRLAQRTGRTDVCALPSGISVPHMFVVTFVIMLPIAAKTGDPVRGWEAGLTWVFIQSFVLMAGGFVAPIIRKITPRAALLGTLAGVSIAFISMRPALDMFMTPIVAIPCFAIILASWFGGVRYFKGIPAGLVAIAVGSIIAWGSSAAGLGFGGMSSAKLGEALSNFHLSFPTPAIGHVFSGFQFLGVILVTAIPFGIYDLVEAIDNVESAAVAGDSFPTTRVLTADGIVSLLGCMMGNPFINAVYIGHPGWKAMGGRIGYSAATGLMVIIFVLARDYLGHGGAHPGSGDLAHSPLYRDAHRLAGVSRDPEEPRARHRPRAHAEQRRVGKAADTQRPGRRGNQRLRRRVRQAGPERHPLSRSVSDGWRLDPRRAGARRNRRLRDRAPVHEVGRVRRRRRGADVLRVHARRGHRHQSDPDSGHQLPGGGSFSRRLREVRNRTRPGGARASRTRACARRVTSSRGRSRLRAALLCVLNARLLREPSESRAFLDISSLRHAYREGAAQPADVVDAVIASTADEGNEGIWIHLRDAEDLRAEARRLEALPPANPAPGTLWDPFAVKDNIDVAGVPTTVACPEFAYVPEHTAPVVDRLRALGALFVGKTNLDQFATGLVGVRSPYGIPKNPFDARYVTGGSSSGSAAAVARGQVSFSIATDTAGSGRVPAAFNNLVGLKPSRGLLSTRGLVPACQSIDCMTFLTLTCDDARELAVAATGFDAMDPYSRREAAHFQWSSSLSSARGVRVAIPRDDDLTFGDAFERERFASACARLEAMGMDLERIDMAPFYETGELLYGGPWVAERLSGLETFLEAHSDAVLPVIRSILAGGARHRATDAFRAHRLAELRRAIEPLWDRLAALVVPTVPLHPRIDEVLADPIGANARLGRYTTFGNLLDLAAVAVPGGFRPNGLPSGVTFIGPWGCDASLLTLASAFHAATGGSLGATRWPLPSSAPPSPRSSESTLLRSPWSAPTCQGFHSTTS